MCSADDCVSAAVSALWAAVRTLPASCKPRPSRPSPNPDFTPPRSAEALPRDPRRSFIIGRRRPGVRQPRVGRPARLSLASSDPSVSSKPLMGFEPMTSALPRMRSTTELQRPVQGAHRGHCARGRREAIPNTPARQKLAVLSRSGRLGRFRLRRRERSKRTATLRRAAVGGDDRGSRRPVNPLDGSGADQVPRLPDRPPAKQPPGAVPPGAFLRDVERERRRVQPSSGSPARRGQRRVPVARLHGVRRVLRATADFDTKRFRGPSGSILATRHRAIVPIPRKAFALPCRDLHVTLT
jgi:hypothetical protein